MRSTHSLVLSLALAAITAACGSNDSNRRVERDEPGDGGGDAESQAAEAGATDAASLDSGAPPVVTPDASVTPGPDGSPPAPDGGAPPAADGSVPGDAATPVDAGNPGPRGLFVSPTAGDDANPGTDAAPLKTMLKAFSQAVAGQTVWLQDGTFTSATEGQSPLNVSWILPAGVDLRAVNRGQVTITFPLVVQGGAHVVDGVSLAPGFGYNALYATGGTVTLRRTTLGASGGSGTCTAAIRLEGTAQATLDAEGDAAFDYAAAQVRGFATLLGSSQLTVLGGLIDDVSSPGCSPGASIVLGESSRATFSGVTITHATHPAFLLMGTTELALTAGSVLDVPNVGNSPNIATGIWVGEGATTAKVTVKGSTITGAFAAALRLDTGTPTITLDGATITTTNGRAILAQGTQLRGDAATATPNITVKSSTLTGNPQGGICLTLGGSVDISNSTLTGNGSAATNVTASCGGLGLIGTTSTYNLKIRGTQLSNNVMATPSAQFAGLRLEGSATSVFDLGTTASPGGNTWTGNSTTALRLNADVAATVRAVGNKWVPSVQGANASGDFALGQAPCGQQAPCTVTTGSGANYIVTSGTLTLIQ